MSIVVSQLYIYPVKSLGGVALASMRLVDGGPAWDRRWMIVDAQGRFLTQREFPKLAQVEVALEIEAATIRLTAPRAEPLLLPLTVTNELTQPVVIWNDSVRAVYGGEAGERWISAYLGVAASFVYMPDSEMRVANQAFAQPGDVVSFADGFPLLLIGEASLQNFNSHLDQAIAMQRFRPNVVVAGSSAYAEDSWCRLQLGQVDCRVVKPCARCVIPSINPSNAQQEPQVARALAKHRRGRGGVYFGQNVIHEANGEISLDDTVVLLEVIA